MIGKAKIGIVTDDVIEESTESWLDLCLVPSDEDQNEVSFNELLHGLPGFYKLIHLLSGAFINDRSQPLKDSAALRRKFEIDFLLKCHQTKPGSYLIPVDLELP